MPLGAPNDREDLVPRFLVLQNYTPVPDQPPIHEWDVADVHAHINFQDQLNKELTDSGELVDAQGLAGPELA